MAKIYLSATYQDLKPCRDAVYRILRMLRHDVISMEDYVATDDYPLNKCLDDVASCKIYIGLLGWRYGYIPDRDNSESKSITELEYRKAGDSGLPRLMFLAEETAPWLDEFKDTETGDGDDGRLIGDFRAAMENARLVSHFRTPDHLAGLVSVAVQRCLEDQPTENLPVYNRVAETRRTAREQELNNLLEEYQAATEQLAYTQDAVVRIRVKRQIESLEKELGDVGAQIGKLGTESMVRLGPLSTNQAFLEGLFTNPPVSTQELQGLVLGSLPADQTHGPPADSPGIDMFRWLADRLRLSDGRVPLLEVLASLSPRITNGLDETRLERAIKEIAEHFEVERPTPRDGHCPDEERAQSALLVEIWPTGSGTKSCNVHARLFRKMEPDSVHVQEGDEALRLGDPGHLKELVQTLRGILVTRGIRVEESLVEFALPMEFLSLDVDQWADRVGDPWGTYLPLVIRSWERLRQPDLQLGWPDNWIKFSDNFKKKLPEPLWWMSESTRRRLRGKVEEGNCIALDYVPDTTVGDSDNTLLSLVSTGAPVVLWPRREEGLCDLKDQLEDFLRDKPVGELPRILRDLRLQLWENNREESLCYHLTLLWDDPARRLPLTRDEDDYYQAPA